MDRQMAGIDPFLVGSEFSNENKKNVSMILCDVASFLK